MKRANLAHNDWRDFGGMEGRLGDNQVWRRATQKGDEGASPAGEQAQAAGHLFLRHPSKRAGSNRKA